MTRGPEVTTAVTTDLAATLGPAASVGADGPSLPVYLAIVLGLAVACQWAAWAMRIPSLLLLLVAGFALGQQVRADEVLGSDALFSMTTIAVGIILFEGSLSLRLRELRGISGPVVRLCTSVVLIAWVLLSGAAWLVGVDIRLAVLVGAILVVTGPTVINPILRQMRPTRRVSSLLRWEGIVVDPIGAILAVLVFQAIVAGRADGTVAAVLITLGITVAVAVLLSVPVGLALGWAVRRHWVPDYLQGVLFLAVAVAALVASNTLASESGLLTVTLLGIVLANQPGLELHHVREFKEHLQVLLVGVLFVLLAGRVSVDDVREVAPQALAFVALAVLVVRPVSIGLGLLGTSATREERTLLAFMAPRGIVAAAVTSIFALELGHGAESLAEEAREATDPAAGAELAARAEALASLGEQADALVPLVFLLIVATVALYGLGVGRLAERLGLASTSPQGVLFAGADRWVIEAAEQLERLDVPTMVVHDRYTELAPARMAGLRTVTTNIVSEFAVEDLELGGIGTFIGATEVDSTNSTAAREFAHILGRTDAWQLRRGDDPDEGGTHRNAPAAHLVARYPFAPALTRAEMTARSADGMAVRRTTLTEAFTYEDFRREHPAAVVLFAHREGRLRVVSEGGDPPPAGTVLLALRREREVDQHRAAKKGTERITEKGTERGTGVAEASVPEPDAP